MSSSPALNQNRFRIRTDTGAVTGTPTWAAAEDTGASIAVETPFRIRFQITNPGAAAGAGPQILRVSKNGGAYTAVTTSTGATLGAQSNDSSTSADETVIAIGDKLLSGTVADSGVYDETGSATKSIAATGTCELEYGLILKTAGAAAGNTFDFRLYNSTTAFTTYTQTPRVTVPRALLANDIVSASSVGHKIIFRSVNYASYGGSRTSTVVPKPSGLIVGDFMLWAQVTAIAGGGGAGSAPDPTFPAGWTQISSAGYPLTPGSGGFDADFRVAYKFADSSDVAASDFTATHSTCSSQGAIACWTGVSTTTPFDVTPSQNFWNSGIADSTALSLTTVTNGSRIVIWGMDWGDTAVDLSPPGGTTPTFAERLDVAPLMHMFDGVLATAGATGDKTWANNSATAAPWACYMLALRPAVVVPSDACLANDVSSASSVSQPALQQVHNPLANDVKSNSSVTQPVLGIRRDLLANDVTSNSSVSVPTAVHIVPPVALLANDVKSNSSVSQPAAVIRRDVLANDVISGSSVSQPAAGIQRAILANDVASASSVTGPVLGILGQADARDVTSTSNVSQPALQSLHGLLATDVKSASSVTTSLVAQRQILDAVNVVSPSSVTTPVAGEIAAGQPLANDIVSASSVSTPTLVVEGEVIPVPPEVGGGGKVYGRGYPRKRWEELLRLLEAERQEALERAQAFRGTKDRKQAKKAARAASEAIAAAREAADEAAVLAHAGTITRMLEGAAGATSLAEYLERMKAAKAEAEAMEDEDDVETVLMMVA